MRDSKNKVERQLRKTSQHQALAYTNAHEDEVWLARLLVQLTAEVQTIPFYCHEYG